MFPRFMRNMKLRTHEDTVKWAEKGTKEKDVYGIMGKSVFMEVVPNFDVVKDMLPEPMHLLDGGFFKNIMGKLYNVTAAKSHNVMYRRSKTDGLNVELL